MADGSPLKVAVIGGGAMGSRHLRKFTEIPGVTIVGLVDPDATTEARATAVGVRRYETLGGLLTEAPIDAVCVATPTPTHHEIVREVLSHGIHVLVEKP